jgi:hypothetical protein
LKQGIAGFSPNPLVKPAGSTPESPALKPLVTCPVQNILSRCGRSRTQTRGLSFRAFHMPAPPLSLVGDVEQTDVCYGADDHWR